MATVQAAFEALLDTTEARLRAIIRQWRDGTEAVEGLLDNDGVHVDRPVRYAVTVTVDGEQVEFDFSGCDPQTEGPVNSSPALFDGVVIFSSVDGSIYGIDAATGTKRWSFATRGERRFTAPGIHGAIPRTERMPDPFDLFLSSPTIVDGVAYIGSGDQHVYALDARTGTLRWSFASGDVIHASPAFGHERRVSVWHVRRL